MPSQDRIRGELPDRMRSERRSVGLSNEAHNGNLYSEEVALIPEQVAMWKWNTTQGASIEIRQASDDNLPTHP